MRTKFSLLGILMIGFLLSFSTLTKKTIIIDAGHGGSDNGASVNQTYEKDINNNIAQIIKELSSQNKNIEIILTHDGKTVPSLGDRISFINKINPDLVISLHTNSSPNKDKNGVEIFVQNNEKSKQLAERLTSLFEKSEVKEQNLKLLRDSNSPAVIIEMGFLSNEKDREYLTTADGQREMATKILHVIEEK